MLVRVEVLRFALFRQALLGNKWLDAMSVRRATKLMTRIKRERFQYQSVLVFGGEPASRLPG